MTGHKEFLEQLGHPAQLARRPVQAELLALDELYTALVSVRGCEFFNSRDLHYDVSWVLHSACVAALGTNASADRLLDYLDDHPTATLLDAYELVYG